MQINTPTTSDRHQSTHDTVNQLSAHSSSDSLVIGKNYITLKKTSSNKFIKAYFAWIGLSLILDACYSVSVNGWTHTAVIWPMVIFGSLWLAVVLMSMFHKKGSDNFTIDLLRDKFFMRASVRQVQNASLNGDTQLLASGIDLDQFSALEIIPFTIKYPKRPIEKFIKLILRHRNGMGYQLIYYGTPSQLTDFKHLADILHLPLQYPVCPLDPQWLEQSEKKSPQNNIAASIAGILIMLVCVSIFIWAGIDIFLSGNKGNVPVLFILSSAFFGLCMIFGLIVSIVKKICRSSAGNSNS